MSSCLLTWHEGGKGCNTHFVQCETEETAAFCSHPALLQSSFSTGKRHFFLFLFLFLLELY